MSILDDAIREHLELKRAHGADDAELKKLEDEAFGPPGRPDDPDPFAEAPTEFLTSPATDAGEAAADAQAEPSGRRAPNIADLQEAPPAPKEPEPAEPEPAEPEPAEPSSEAQPAVEQPTIPVPHPESDADRAAETASAPDSAPSPAPEIDAGHSTEERHAIAEQPTEFFDVEADLGGDTKSQPRSPSDEELVDSQIAEPRLAPVDPLDAIKDTGPDAELAHEPDEEEEDDDFFSEQRLSDELNKALEAPVTDEHLVIPAPDTPGPATDEHAVAPTTDEHLAPVTDEHAVAPTTDEHEHEPLSTDEHDAVPHTDDQPAIPTTEEGTAIYQVPDADLEDEDDDLEDDEPAAADPKDRHEDLLEDTPDFLEDAPEDDNLWFEQKPPKDFDFDD